jgi:hypothetical protein
MVKLCITNRARRFAASAALVAVGVASWSVPASAAGVSVSPAHDLDPAGQIVVVRGSGFRPGTALFVMECRASSAEDHTCNSVGLQKVTTDANGSFATRLSVVGRFGATDCLQVPCGVKTSAVSGHSGDRSQDTNAAISFRATPVAPPATAPPATAVPGTAAPGTAPPAVTTPPAPAPTTSTTFAPSSTSVAPTTTTEATAATTTESPRSTTTSSSSDGAGDEVATPAASGRAEDSGGGRDGGAPVGALVVGGVLAAAAFGGGVLVRRRTLA